MTDKKENIKPDVPNGGKMKYTLDVDRIINEGMAGGTVKVRGNRTNIEEARELPIEEPPHYVD